MLRQGFDNNSIRTNTESDAHKLPYAVDVMKMKKLRYTINLPGGRDKKSEVPRKLLLECITDIRIETKRYFLLHEPNII